MHTVNADDRPDHDEQADDADQAIVCIELWRTPSGGGLTCRLRRTSGDEFLQFDSVDLAEVARGLRRLADRDAAELERRQADPSRQREQRPQWKGAGNGPARPSATPRYVGEIEEILATAGWPPAGGP